MDKNKKLLLLVQNLQNLCNAPTYEKGCNYVVRDIDSCMNVPLTSPLVRFPLNLLWSLPNDKILDWSKLKAVADNNVNVTKN